MEIHNVHIYGRVKNEYLETLSKIEKFTPPSLWYGIKGVYFSDLEYKKETGNCGLYGYSGEEFSFTLMYNDGSSEDFDLNKNDFPCILIDGGYLKDEYAFAINLLHELGHHNNKEDEDENNKAKNEINAHVFAMQYISEENFQKIEEPRFYFWNQAKHWKNAIDLVKQSDQTVR